MYVGVCEMQLECAGPVLMQRMERQGLDRRFVGWRRQRSGLVFQKISAALSRRLKAQHKPLCRCSCCLFLKFYFYHVLPGMNQE